jgi:hypothetical protein
MMPKEPTYPNYSKESQVLILKTALRQIDVVLDNLRISDNEAFSQIASISKRTQARLKNSD